MSIVSKEIMSGTATNYALLVARLVCSIFMTRILFLGLGESLYGFWGFLWAIFGYSVMLDFGFGQTIQKFTAESDVTRDIHSFNKLVSTVMLVFCAFSLVIAGTSIIIAYFLEHIVTIGADSTVSMSYLKTSFAVFGVGVAIVFPTGIFPEILAGVRRFDIKNAILLVNVIANLAGFYVLIDQGYSVLAIAIFTAALNLLTNIAMIIFIIRILPGFRISPFLADFAKLKEISSFSIYSYICTVSDIFITRVDRIIIGYFLGISSLGIYQVGTRLPEMMDKLTTQFQSTLGPVAASIYKSGDFEKLRWILLRSSKISAFITGYFLVVFLLLSVQILKVWLKIEDSLAVNVTAICLVSVFTGVAFRSVQGKFLLMAGEHKRLAIIHCAYAILNVSLMLALVKAYGLIGIAVGGLISNTIISVFVEFPLSVRLGKMKISYYARKVFLPLLIPMLLSAAVIGAFLHYLGNWSLLKITLVAATAGIAYLVSGWLFYFDKDDRRKLIDISKTEKVLRKFGLLKYLGLGQ